MVEKADKYVNTEQPNACTQTDELPRNPKCTSTESSGPIMVTCPQVISTSVPQIQIDNVNSTIQKPTEMQCIIKQKSQLPDMNCDTEQQDKQYDACNSNVNSCSEEILKATSILNKSVQGICDDIDSLQFFYSACSMHRPKKPFTKAKIESNRSGVT